MPFSNLPSVSQNLIVMKGIKRWPTWELQCYSVLHLLKEIAPDDICELSRVTSTQLWALRTPKHSLNPFSEPRPSRTLELVEASKK